MKNSEIFTHVNSLIDRGDSLAAENLLKTLLNEFSCDKEKELILKYLAQLYLRLKEYNKLQAVLEELLDTYPENIEAMQILSELYAQQGHYQKVIAIHQNALKNSINPSANLLYNLAFYLRQAGSFEQAVRVYKEAIQNNVQNPKEVHLNISVIYADYLNDQEKASMHLDAAIELDKNYADAWFNYGNLKERTGDAQMAKEFFLKAHECKPANINAIFRLADLSHFTSRNDPDFILMLKALARSNSDDERCNLLYGLGKASDDFGDYEQAWYYYSQANAINRRYNPKYSRLAHDNLIASIKNTFSNELDVSPASFEQASTPVFICGMFRSGSTLCEQILTSSREVCSFGEVEFMHRTIQTSAYKFPEDWKVLKQEIKQSIIDGYRSETSCGDTTYKYFIDKRPENFLYVAVLHQIYPTAKFIFTKRDVFDNALSAYFQRLGSSMNYAADLADFLHYHSQYEKLTKYWKVLFGKSVLFLDYDNLVSNPEMEIKEMFRFLGLEYDDSALNFYQNKEVVKTASVWQVRKPLYKTSSGRTANYIEFIKASGNHSEFCEAYHQSHQSGKTLRNPHK